MLSIGLTWNCELRDNGTAYHARRALESMPDVETKHYQARGEVGKHDFYLYVDDGRDDIQWLPPHPNAYWAIDTHLGYGYRLWKARKFDRVFVAQKDAVEQFKRDGVEHVEWLPLACDPEKHCTAAQLRAKGAVDVEKRWDVAFVGFLQERNEPGYNNRVAYLDRLYREFPNSWLSVNVFFEAMALRFAKARVGFNVSIKRDLNMRAFEVMSVGVPLLTNADVEGIGDLFVEGKHYQGYVGPDEMVEGARHLLENPEQAERMASEAHALVRSKHTYADRMRHVIEEMKHAA